MILRPEPDTPAALGWAALSPDAREGWERFARRFNFDDPLEAMAFLGEHLAELIPGGELDELVERARAIDRRAQN